jgi:hypothetical protein
MASRSITWWFCLGLGNDLSMWEGAAACSNAGERFWESFPQALGPPLLLTSCFLSGPNNAMKIFKSMVQIYDQKKKKVNLTVHVDLL